MSTATYRPLLTTAEVARLVGVNVDTIHRWVDAGYLRVVRVGPRGRFRFRQEDVERLINGETP